LGQRRTGAAERTSHSSEIRERAPPFDRRQPRDRSPTIGDHDLASLLHVVEQIREVLPRFSYTGGSHPHIVSQVALQFQPENGVKRALWVSNWGFSRRIQDSATLCGTRRLAYADSRVRNFLLTLLHLAVTTATLCGPGGVRAVIAESLLLKQQLIVLRRGRRRAPTLTLSDRLLCGLESLFLSLGRIQKVAIALRPSTLLAFHQALVRRKYGRLFSSTPCPKKPGPKGPDQALIQAIVELKSRYPRFGCPRIALIISQRIGVAIDKHVETGVFSNHYRPAPGGIGASWLSFLGH
jgi:hypothetical protein